VGGVQEQIGRRLAAPDVLRAEDAAGEAVEQPGRLQGQADPLV